MFKFFVFALLAAAVAALVFVFVLPHYGAAVQIGGSIGLGAMTMWLLYTVFPDEVEYYSH